METIRNDEMLSVNGQTHDVTADPDRWLLLALRNDLGLDGAKVGCALSQCGACTVLRDGEPIRSCVATVRAAAGTEITTLEGFGTAEPIQPIQQALLDKIFGLSRAVLQALQPSSRPSPPTTHSGVPG